MSLGYDAVEQGLRTLEQVSQAILELELEEEGGIERLAELQEMQEQLKEQLNEPLISGLSRDPRLQKLIASCLALSQQVDRKLTIFRNYISEQMNKLQDGDKSRTAYNNAYTQAEGYFIDFRK